jgi:hypothetical protein
MSGVKGRSGRKTHYEEMEAAEIVNLSQKTILDYLKDENISREKKIIVAQPFALKAMPQKIEGKGFGDLNIYAIINQIQQDFISKSSEPSLVLDRGDGMDTGRTRPNNTIQEIPQQGIS